MSQENMIAESVDSTILAQAEMILGAKGWNALNALCKEGGVISTITISGTDVYIGGSFFSISGVRANNIAKWNGSAWSALGTGCNSSISLGVAAIAVIGTDVYAGGYFNLAGGVANTANLAKWSGSAWSSIGNVDNYVQALAVINTDLYVGGAFTGSNLINGASKIAKWNGSVWSALGRGCNTGSVVNALAVSGSDLYIGGDFSNTLTALGASVPNTSRIAKWNGSGSVWSALGTGCDAAVHCITVSGANIYAGGDFNNVGTRIARWNGTTWSSLSSGCDNRVLAIAVIGSTVYVGGYFGSAGGQPTTSNLAKWSGSAWSAVGAGCGIYPNAIVFALAVSGTDLYIGGTITTAGGQPAINLAKWSGSAYSTFGVVESTCNINALALSGTDLYVGGDFTTARGVPNTSCIAKWNGSVWSALGTGCSLAGGGSYVSALAFLGSDLYIGGVFPSVGGIGNTLNIAKWNGSVWSALGTGCNGLVRALFNYSGTMCAGGDFTQAGGVTDTSSLARWNGSALWPFNEWSSIGNFNGSVHALASVTGYALYAGGSFTFIGATSAKNIASYNGSNWSALGTGCNSTVRALAEYSGSLYVGGDFTDKGERIAKWTPGGTSWGGFNNNMKLNNPVYSIAVSGTAIYVGGSFTSAVTGSTQIPGTSKIAKWNSDTFTWSSLLGGAGCDNTVRALVVAGSNLYLGGSFTSAGGVAADSLALYEPAFTVTYAGNGSTGGTVPVDGNSPYALGGNVTVIGAGTLVRANYTFANWNISPGGGGTAYAPSATISNIQADVTLYAQWTPIMYTLSFDGNGSTGGTPPANDTRISGSSITIRAPWAGNGFLVKYAYTFSSWNTAADGSGTSYINNSTLVLLSGTLLYAQWTPIMYTLSFDGNGSTGGSVPIDSGVYASGATVTVLGNTGNLIRTNYTFSGWNTQNNGNGTSYTAGQTFVMGSSNVTLYAIWLDAVAPSVGTGIITPSSVTTSQVILSWDKATDTISSQANLQYLAYYSINPSLDSLLEIETNGIAVDIYAANIATKTVTGLSSVVTYYFNVIVKDEIGNKAAYTKLTQATEAIVPFSGYSTPVVETYYAVSKGDIGVTGIAGGIKSATVVNENYLALSGDLVVCRQGASVTLPANPVVGDWVKIILSPIEVTTSISVAVHRNGSKINSSTNDATLTHNTLAGCAEEILAVYQDSTVGWCLKI